MLPTYLFNNSTCALSKNSISFSFLLQNVQFSQDLNQGLQRGIPRCQARGIDEHAERWPIVVIGDSGYRWKLTKLGKMPTNNRISNRRIFKSETAFLFENVNAMRSR